MGTAKDWMQELYPEIKELATGATGRLTDAISRYYKSLGSERGLAAAEALEQLGMGGVGSRHSTAAADAITRSQERFTSDWLRELAGAEATGAQIEQQGQSLGANLLSALYGTGQTEWEMANKGLESQYGEWSRVENYPQDVMKMVTSAAGQRVPVGTTAASDSSASKDACCFIFIAAKGHLPFVARLYRDLKMNRRNRRGYYWLADRLVPLMEKFHPVKKLVKAVMVNPMLAYGEYYFGMKCSGVIFAPIAAFWLLTFTLLGLRPPYRRRASQEVV